VGASNHITVQALRSVGVVLAVMVTIPFVVTGLFLVLPASTPTIAPFAALAMAGAGLASAKRRTLAAGVLVGTAMWAVALFIIVASMGSGLTTID
jgi:hypothetical protein